MMTKDKIFLESKAWAQEMLALDREYFERLNGMHHPTILWIGSSDSLVPVSEVTNTDPGEILVYHNIASQVHEDDLSLMAVVQDAVEVDRVEYIVLCGYSHCSGVRDVLLGADDRPYVKRWLQNLRRIYEENLHTLQHLDFSEKEKQLCQLNVKAQIKNLSNLESVQKAWEKHDYPILYGWYFDLDTGSFEEVISLEQNHKNPQLV